MPRNAAVLEPPVVEKSIDVPFTANKYSQSFFYIRDAMMIAERALINLAEQNPNTDFVLEIRKK